MPGCAQLWHMMQPLTLRTRRLLTLSALPSSAYQPCYAMSVQSEVVLRCRLGLNQSALCDLVDGKRSPTASLPQSQPAHTFCAAVFSNSVFLRNAFAVRGVLHCRLGPYQSALYDLVLPPSKRYTPISLLLLCLYSLQSEVVLRCRLGPYQSALYDLVKSKLREEEGGSAGVKGINNTVMELRNICNHPTLRCVPRTCMYTACRCAPQRLQRRFHASGCGYCLAVG
jgi:hypothetical protein